VIGLLVTIAAGVTLLARSDTEVSSAVPAAPSTTEVPPTPVKAWNLMYVATDGAVDGDGSAEHPFRSLTVAFEALQPGDVLLVGGGTYHEDVKPVIRPGTAYAPVQVTAVPGERPVVAGLLWLDQPDFWVLRGINVTWSDRNGSGDHMVKITGGESWEFTDAELWDARSYAALLVAGDPTNFLLARLFIHDTHPSNDENQDHLIYLNSGTGRGVIEHCLLVRSPNGRAIKVGGPARNEAVANLVIRYNTMYDNAGPSNVQLSYWASSIRIERNILVKPGPGNSAVTGFHLSGDGNIVVDNIAWDALAVIEPGLDAVTDGGGNRLLDPEFVDPSADDFRPQADDALAYGYLAG